MIPVIDASITTSSFWFLNSASALARSRSSTSVIVKHHSIVSLKYTGFFETEIHS